MNPQEGELRPGQKFQLSNYREGFYQTDGSFSPEPFLSDQSIARWDDENKRIMDGKAWGSGQALFFQGEPLIFGRQADFVDVIVDTDPGSDGSMQRELGVSRRHFQITPTPDGIMQITDLGSTNGVKIFSVAGKTRAKLNAQHPNAILQPGDFALIGGGVENPENPDSRMIGFRACLDDKGKTFLVKFTAKEESDFLALIGKVRDQEEATVAISEKPELSEAVSSGYEQLLSLVGKVKEALDNPPSIRGSEVIRSQTRLVQETVNIGEKIATQHFNGDLSEAIFYLGIYALKQGERLYRQSDKVKAARAAEVSLFLGKLAKGEFIQQVQGD